MLELHMVPLPAACFVNQYGDGARQRASSAPDEVGYESVSKWGKRHFEMTIGQVI
jgi:hypothetical protein